MQAFLVFQSDFGMADGAVSAMKGVAYSVDPGLVISDITHEITPYKSVIARTAGGQYIVTPNNGTLTHIAAFLGITELRLIEEQRNRLKNSEASYTFYGRDVYAYTGARLAAGLISFEEVGPRLEMDDLVSLDLYGATLKGSSVTGQIDILDVRFGSLWTSIPFETFNALGISFGDYIEVRIFRESSLVYINQITYGRSFADVMVGMPVLYMNSVGHMALAINQGSFARAYNIGTGPNLSLDNSDCKSRSLTCKRICLQTSVYHSEEELHERYARWDTRARGNCGHRYLAHQGQDAACLTGKASAPVALRIGCAAGLVF